MNSLQHLPELAVNMLFRRRDDPKSPLQRIVWTGNQSYHTFYVPVSGDEWPQACLTDELRARFSPEYEGDDALVFVAEDPHAVKLRAEPSAFALERMRWISDLVKGQKLFDILTPNQRGKAIQQQVAKVGKSRATISFQLKRFLARGMTVSALEGDLDKCGGRGKQRNALSKVGARRSVKAGDGTQVNDSNRSILEAGVSFLLGAPKRTLQLALDFIHEKFCHDWPATKLFTRRQLQHHLFFTRPFTQRRRKKHGERRFNLSMRAFNGTVDTYGPGAQYQIDATIADVYLVSALDRLSIVGRPTIYIVSDTFSRQIVGVHISLAPPSIEGAALAMESVVTPKVALCAEYGIETKEEHWPAHHLPRELLGDRGSEFISVKAWDRTVQRLVMDVANTAAYRPDWKSIVESRFNLLNAVWAPFVPGYVDKDFKERGGKDYRLDAVLTLREFTAVFLISVIEYNNRPLRTKKQIPEMVAAKLSPTPVELWRFGISKLSGELRTVHVDEVRACVYPRGEATVSEYGIGFATRFYETPRAEKEEWFVRARKTNFKVEVAYDPINPAKLFVIHEDGSFERAKLRMTGQQYDEVVSLAEIGKLQKDAARTLNDGFDKAEPLKRALRDQTEAIIEGAIKEKEERMVATGVKKLDTTDIREAKASERELEELLRSGQIPDLLRNEAPVEPPKKVGEDAEESWEDFGDLSIALLEAAKKTPRDNSKGDSHESKT
jgi:hypothetical protein